MKTTTIVTSLLDKRTITLCWVSFVRNPVKLTLPAKYVPEGQTPEEALNWAFRQFNRVDGKELVERLKIKRPSLSVGDMVQVDDQLYVCSFIGWDKPTEFQTRLWNKTN